MTYEKSDEVFNNLLEYALVEDKNIAEGMSTTGIPRIALLSLLRENIQKKKKEIWDSAALEIIEVEKVETIYQSKQEELQISFPYSRRKFPFSRSNFQELLSSNLVPWCILITVLLIIIGIVASVLSIWVAFLKPLISHLGLMIIVGGIMISFCIFLYLLSRFLEIRRKRMITSITDELDKKREEIGIKELKERYDEANAVVQRAVHKEILRELRLAINTHLKPSYETFLSVISAPGLAEVFNPAYEHEISTESKGQLLRRIKNMAGGSIGIAGPRGAGKTTLLRSIRFSSEELQPGRPTLSVLIPAPVEYSARDFILLIFSEICSRVLELEKVKVRTPWASLNEMQQSSVENHSATHLFHLLGMKSIRVCTLIAIIVGLIFVTTSIVLVNVLSTSTDTSTSSTSIQQSNTPTSSQSTSTPPSSNHLDILTTYLTALEIEPSTLFPWGLFLVGCGSTILLINRNAQKELLEKDKQKQREENQERFEKEEKRKESEKKPLVTQARGWLDNIRFQQSYSSGWSGSLQLPLALGGAINSAVSLAQNQLSLPEIIEEYRHFLEVVTAKYTVVIAIDEMDKLESDEKAERFLNEIKVLFGLPYCFYLISVSESAMSSFERRGLPFRDVFDSSFDGIISVDYLNFQSADLLLKKRVIGLPVPFVALCYCLSGGLARDLIRRCRDLLERVQTTPTENTLAKLCHHLIASDIQMILHASVIAAKKKLPAAELDQFFEIVKQLEEEIAGASISLKSIAYLLHNTKNDVTQDIKKYKVNSKVDDKISISKNELGTYLYYAVTILEYFTSKVDSDAWKAIKGFNDFNRLARIRQYFGISLHGACKMISEFREGQGWEFVSDLSS